MRILYLSNQRLPTEKAYGIQITKMAEAFGNEGVNITLAFPARKNKISEGVFNFYGVNQSFRVNELSSPDFYWPGPLDKLAFYLKNIFSALVLVKFTLKVKPDIVYSRDGLPLFILSFFRNHLVYEAHKFASRRNLIYKRFRNMGVRVVVITDGIQEEFDKTGFKPDKVLVAPDAVDPEEFDIPETKDDCRKKLDLPLNRKLLGYVGQLRTMGVEKGVGTLLDTQRLLKDRGSNLMSVIVGGSDADLKHYHQIAEQKGLSGEDILFVGRKKHSDIPYYLRAFDILAMPFPATKHYSLYMSPLKLFEYMASGRPIVASDLPSIRAVLNDESAVFFEPASSQQFMAAIQKVLTDENLARSISLKALERSKDFTWRKRAQTILKFIGKTS